MHERQDWSGHEELAALLVSDFFAPPPVDQSDSAIGRLLGRAVATDEVDRRLATPENLAVGNRVTVLMADAPVTTSFKAFIADELRQAHAWQRPVDPAVSPSALGLD